jgi:hypothetical protein
MNGTEVYKAFEIEANAYIRENNRLLAERARELKLSRVFPRRLLNDPRTCELEGARSAMVLAKYMLLEIVTELARSSGAGA